MKNAASLFVAIILVAGSPFAQEETTGIHITGEDDLVEEKGQFQGTWVHPDADITRYEKLYMWSAVFQFRAVDNTGGTTTQMLRDGGSGPFTISDDSRTRFEGVVSEAIVAELGRSNTFEVADSIGPGVLLVRAAVLDIVSNVPPNVGRSGNVHLNAVGEATMVFELIDAETGVIQARVAERRRIQPPGRMNDVSASPTTSATVWNDVQRWARDQARILRRELERAKKRAQ